MEKAHKKLDILLVDDTPMILKMVEAWLKMHHGVTTATNAREALEVLAKKSFDLMITDMHMPDPHSGDGTGISGLELILTVRHLNHHVDVIWLASAEMTEHMAATAARVGAHKAIKKEEVLNHLRQDGILPKVW